MGYCMTQMDCNFFVEAKNISAMTDAIKDLADAKHSNEHKGGSWRDGEKKASWYSWVDMSFSQLTDIKSMFKCWRWEIDYDDAGDISQIQFAGEKLGQDDVLFNAIAPFVKNNSFIEMEGEDGTRWRWVFKNGKCIEKQAKVSWK